MSVTPCANPAISDQQRRIEVLRSDAEDDGSLYWTRRPKKIFDTQYISPTSTYLANVEHQTTVQMRGPAAVFIMVVS